MKKFLFCAASISLFMISCNQKTDNVREVSQKTNSVNTSDIKIEAIPENCYMLVDDKDTIILKYSDNLGTVTGKMKYNMFEKDKAVGDLVGFSSGDTLKVDYMFQAEGNTSSREMWFLKKDGELLEGTGDYDASGEKYRNAKSVHFDKGHILKSADCKMVNKALL